MKTLTEHHLAILRRHMVEVVDIGFDLMSEEIGKISLDPRVRTAFLKVPRHLFVPAEMASFAYQDTPLPIGFNKTISQPFITALMVDLLDLAPSDRVLEVGTGLGYQAAVLAELVENVFSVEIVEEFAVAAGLRLQQLGYENVTIRVGDGSRGWVEYAPFDHIVVTAAVKQPPQALVDQLKPGGRLTLPLGAKDAQRLVLIEKQNDGQLITREIMPARFTELETGICG